MKPDVIQMLTLLPEIREHLSDDYLVKLTKYIKLVEEYKGALNLTGYRGADDLVQGLVGESLRMNELGLILPQTEVIDLGSGNGSPVVPLAIVCPRTSFTAVESRMKRGAFLERVKAVLHLQNLSVRIERAETTAEAFPGHFDIAISRGFAKPQAFFEMTTAFVKPSGLVIGYCGESPQAVIDAADKLGMINLNITAYQGVGKKCHLFSVQSKG